MGAVEVLVVGHDNVGIARDAQALAGNALALERVELLEHNGGVDDAAVADDRERARVHDAGRDLVKGQLVAICDHRVARVGTALVTADAVEIAGDEVGDLALTLVAPLGSHQYCCRHEDSLSWCFLKACTGSAAQLLEYTAPAAALTRVVLRVS